MLALIVLQEGYNRNALCALNLTFTYLLLIHCNYIKHNLLDYTDKRLNCATLINFNSTLHLYRILSWPKTNIIFFTIEPNTNIIFVTIEPNTNIIFVTIEPNTNIFFFTIQPNTNIWGEDIYRLVLLSNPFQYFF